MPEKTQAIWERLGEKNQLQEEGKKILAAWKKGEFPRFSDGQTVQKGEPLFMRKGGRWK
jgi:hypothetical protein